MTTSLSTFTITEVADDDTYVVRPYGEIDLATVADLDDALTRALSGPWGTIVIDMAEATFLGVVGSHPIEDIAKTCEDRRRAFAISRPQPQARWLLEWLGLGPMILTMEDLPQELQRPAARR